MASTVTLPPISSVPELPSAERGAILDALFEPCPQLQLLSLDTLQTSTFSSYDALIEGVGDQLTALANSSSPSDKVWLHQILAAHPRLGDTAVDSAQSRAEQAQLHGGAIEEAQQLATLNQAYEAAFPGLRYVVFVNGRPRAAVMEDMRRRIARADIVQEQADAIRAMCDIAADRARKLLES